MVTLTPITLDEVSCSKCKKSFKSLNYLNQHIRNKHGHCDLRHFKLRKRKKIKIVKNIITEGNV